MFLYYMPLVLSNDQYSRVRAAKAACRIRDGACHAVQAGVGFCALRKALRKAFADGFAYDFTDGFTQWLVMVYNVIFRFLYIIYNI